MIPVLLLLAVLLGSIPTGYLIGRSFQVDVRQQGSGNIGATNVKRVLGVKAGFLTLLGDVLKGTIAVSLPSIFGVSSLPGTVDLAPFLGIFAIIGHCFSPFLGFHGGKGVATSLGVFIVLAPVPTLLAVFVFGILLKLSGYVSLGSLGAAILLPLFIGYGVPAPYTYSRGTLIASLATACIVIWRHRVNITRLFLRKELSILGTER